MAVGSRLAEDRPTQVERVDDRGRPKVEIRSISPRIRSSDTLPVLNVSMEIESGRAMPIAYESSISKRSASPAATTFLATQRAA